ncbi:MAG: hydrogenase maturation protease [Chromatiales bacterium]|jgi:hydrogenase maturation protease|nr:hydrogenase maturation protease [Chromatiales bacterium]
MSTTRIIGIGNADRGDDAVGPTVIRMLAQAPPEGVVLHTARTDMLALIDTWRAEDQVFLVDAVAPAGSPGRVVRIDASRTPVATELDSFVSSHGFSVAGAIELARALGRLPARLLVYGIEGAGFEPGAPLSPAVSRALPQLVSYLQADCIACTRPH